MSVQKPLSIRDYLEPRLAAAAGGRVSVAAKKGLGSFQDILSRQSTAEPGSRPQGMTISDYLARPVASPHATRLPLMLEPGTEDPPATERSMPKGKRTANTGAGQAVPGASVSGSRLARRSASEARGPGARLKGSPAGGPIDEIIRAAAEKYRLRPELIRGVIRAESNFQADAVSPAGAQGLMQLMPETAGELGVIDPFDVRQNIDGGARYLRQMLDRFGGDLKLALAAYNAGPGTVEKYDGKVPYPETQAYVKRVMRSVG